MADAENEETTEPSNANGDGNQATQMARAAAIAAAGAATAYAARKALTARSSSESDSDSGEDSGRGSRGSGGNTGTALVSAVQSGWDVAKGSLMPVIEESATRAGSYVAERAPDIVKDTLLPRFIAGFEEGRGAERKSVRKSKSADAKEAAQD